MPDSTARTPAVVNGLPVVAMVAIPDVAGHLPSRHVVAVRDDFHRTYIVWQVAWNAAYQGGTWTVEGSGRYDIASLIRAIDVVAKRAKGVLFADGLA